MPFHQQKNQVNKESITQTHHKSKGREIIKRLVSSRMGKSMCPRMLSAPKRFFFFVVLERHFVRSFAVSAIAALGRHRRNSIATWVAKWRCPGCPRCFSMTHKCETTVETIQIPANRNHKHANELPNWKSL